VDAWIVIDEDRHAGVNALPFSTEAAAVEYARSLLPDDATEEPLLSQAMRDGWVLCLTHGAEGDCVRVVKRTVDKP